jgi:hypothetical protein
MTKAGFVEMFAEIDGTYFFGDKMKIAAPDWLAGVFAAADEVWPVIKGDGGFLLEWWRDGTPAETEEPLRPDKIRKLADAIELLNRNGLQVTFGMSARGITYLNIDLSDCLTEYEEEEGEAHAEAWRAFTAE